MEGNEGILASERYKNGRHTSLDMFICLGEEF